MATTVIFTTSTNKSGTFAKIMLAIRKQGVRPRRHSITQPQGQDYYLIKFELRENQSVSQHALEAIKEKIPAITRIETDKTAVSTTRPTSAKTSTSGSLVTTDQLNQLGQRLVVAYPQIRREIRRIDEQLDPAVRDDMLLQLGEALGKWQYRKNYSLGARLTLDKTLQRIVWPALEDFLQITKGETFVRVLDCPHCATEQTPTEPNCHFITGYIRGFLEVIPRLPSQQVIQTQSKALGHNACVFEIKQI